MQNRWILGWWAGVLFLAACSGESQTRPGESNESSPAGSGGGEGEGGDKGEDPESVAASQAMCRAATDYAERCDTPVYARYCEETFQYLPHMDLAIKRAFATCFEGACNETSLGKCYAEAIAAAEPHWIDSEELATCADVPGSCTSAARDQLADCLVTGQVCEWPFAASACWHLATLNSQRRYEGMSCDRDSCEAWIQCTSYALHR